MTRPDASLLPLGVLPVLCVLGSICIHTAAIGFISRPVAPFYPVLSPPVLVKGVLVTQRNWMAMYLGRALQGRWNELGDSVHVLRRVDSFLGRHFSVDSEVRVVVSAGRGGGGGMDDLASHGLAAVHSCAASSG